MICFALSMPRKCEQCIFFWNEFEDFLRIRRCTVQKPPGIFAVSRVEIIQFSTRGVFISLLSRHTKARTEWWPPRRGCANLGALTWLHREVMLLTIPHHDSDLQLYIVTAAPTISLDVSLRCPPHHPRLNAHNPLFQADTAPSWGVHVDWGRAMRFIKKTTLPTAEKSVWFAKSMQDCIFICCVFLWGSQNWASAYHRHRLGYRLVL